MRRIEYVKVLMIVLGFIAFGGGVVWGAAGDVVWTFNSDEINSAPAIYGDVIYALSIDDYLYAINKDGTLKWKIQIPINVMGGVSIGFDGTIYASSSDGKLYSINSDGEVNWTYETGFNENCTPAIGADGTIYIGGDFETFYAITQDGELKWSFSANGSIESSASIGNDETIYFGTRIDQNNGYLYAIDSNGEQKWASKLNQGIRWSAPSINNDGTIYVGGQTSSLTSLNPDGTINWEFDTQGGDSGVINCSPVIDQNGYLYFLYDSQNSSIGFYSLKPDGTLRWKKDFGVVLGSTSIIGSDGTIYALDRQKMVALDQNGIIKWSSSIDVATLSSSALSDDGILYFGTREGLYAIDTGTNAGLADSPWPKFQCNNKNTGRKSDMYFAEVPGGDAGGVYHKPFQMSITEVTNQQYADFLNEALAIDWITVEGNQVNGNGGLLKDRLFINLSWQTDNTNKCWITYDGSAFIADEAHEKWPVAGMDWEGAMAYASFYGYSLPAQGEYYIAGSGGKSYEYGTNNGTIHDNNVNFNNTVGHPVDVGSYPANPYGLYDLSGNISEYIFGYGYMVAGNYSSSADECESANHNWEPKETGFRLIDRDVSTFLMFPNGGETFFPGQNVEIIWQSRQDVVNLKYSTDGGSTWQSIGLGVNALDMRYIWEVPNELSDNCKVLIEYGNSSTIFDTSDEVFSIAVDTSLKKLLQDIPFIAVPEGSFTMGFNDGYPGEMPEHKVTLNSFYVGQYEVTQKQYLDVMNTNPSRYDSHEDMPVHDITWYNAVQFCNILSDRAGFDRCYNENTWECDYQKNGFRLPTEAEYEYACRAGTSTLYYFGNEPIYLTNYVLTNYVWNQNSSFGTPRITGQKIPNNWMLYDIVGNVYEWCNDWFDEDYYENSPELNPTGPEDGTDRAYRGDHFAGNTFWSHSAMRGSQGPGGAGPNNGFRIVRRESRTIQGKILDNSGSPVQFASVQITGAVTDTTVVTDDTGTYSLAGWLGGDYTITPHSVAFTFSPESSTVAVGFEDVSANFQATDKGLYVFEHNIPFVHLPDGTFDMGNDDYGPIHIAGLHSFYMSATEITQGTYLSVTGTNPSWYEGNPNLAVVGISWLDAVKFCNMLSELEGLNPCYNETTWECDFNTNGYRLPKEAEWEYACRAGTTTKLYTGDSLNDIDRIAWYGENSGDRPHIVGLKEPNAWGLYDMYGNTWEWCNDWFGAYSAETDYSTIGPESGDKKVLRGGPFSSLANSFGSANRHSEAIDLGYGDVGFRVVRYEYRTVQGKILDESGAPLSNANVFLAGNFIGHNLFTDETGTFSMTAFLGGDLTFTPSKVGCIFSPVSQTVSVGFEDVSGVDFTATVDEKYIIEHGIMLATIPAGSFEMGSDLGGDEGKPVHTVSLDGFLISATEITQGLYEDVLGVNPSSFTGDMTLPVDYVNWYDAVNFCNSLSIKYGLDPCYDPTTWKCDFNKNGYRLPTEAEWEYSCRAGTSTNYYTGDDNYSIGEAEWTQENSQDITHPVGLKMPNPWGLYDMGGNLGEFCHDWYYIDYYSSSPERNPTGPEDGSSKVRRGSDFISPLGWCASAFRSPPTSPDSKGINQGFRIVRRESRTIQGAVNLSGSPLKDAHLLITGAVMDTVITTDDTGSFNISGWLGGDYTITPRKVGYTFSPDTTYVSVGFEDVTLDAFEAEVDTRYVVEQEIHFSKIPAGSFEMGSEDGNENAKPVHEVTLDGFHMSATEVTQYQYSSIIGQNPSAHRGVLNFPVEMVNWFDALIFCNKMSELAGLEKCYNETTWNFDSHKNGYRLPTEAEWEYACRGGTASTYYTGDSEGDLSNAGWYKGNSGGTAHPVGLKESNAYGIYDMHGNVVEWCYDWFDSDYYGSSSSINPTGPTIGSERVDRGGSWIDDMVACHSEHRDFSVPSGPSSYYGFRIVRSLFTIEGTILDDSGNPVDGAEILIASADTDTTVTTDENGFYNLSGLEKGSYTLSPSIYGYGFAEPSYTVATDARPQIVDITALSYLTLTSPLGGEFWETGTEQQITWASNFLSTIKIEYSDDGGSSWAMIASSIDATLGLYMWTVPDIESTDCLIRVTDTIDANVTDKSEAVFTVTKPVFLTLTAMNEGEELINLDTYQITWQSHRVDKIRIEYSPDNGGRWTSIETSVNAALGTYDWNVPDIVTSVCLIRLTDATDANMSAVSEAVFTVIDPTFLTLLAPTGGEQLTQDSEYEIRWDFFRVSKIRIEYTPDGGTRWVTVTSSVDTADSLFVWTVPAVNSTDCKIRITDLSDANFTDMSDTFGIVPPSELMVISPNVGEQWTAGTTVPITWTSAMLTKVTIEYSADGGENWLPVAEALDASLGTFEWAVPDTPSATCLVRISDAEKPETTDRSDSAFTILPAPEVTVTSPNGGEQWAAMTVRDITWDAVNVASVKIEYSTNSATDWAVVVESVDAALGSYALTLPDLASDGCLVRITSTDDPAVTDASDTEFSILQIPAVVLLSPNGGENLITGSTVDIKWSSAYIDFLTVELSTDNGTTWTEIATDKESTLSAIPWTVPDSYSDQCLIRVYEASNEEVVDVSDAVFAIVPPPTLAVTAPAEGDIWNAGTQAVITWTSLSINTLKVEYSTDTGDNWTVIAESVDASAVVASFDVPDLYSAECLVRITDAENTDTVALSGVFTMLPLPSVSVVSPNGAEEFEFGSTQTIQWSATESVASILLEYSTDGGSVWNTLGSALNAADGSMSWDVPAIESSNCLVRATDTNDANVNDQSDESFSITETPYLLLVKPDGGETLTSGDSYDINWDAHRIPGIRIDYSPDGGTQWIKIADSVDGSDSSLSWDVPDISSSDCLIRIVDEQDANRKDTSETAFSIVPKPAITVTYPNGGETLNVGSLQKITWTSVSIQSVKIEYSLDDGSTWLPIIGNVPASDGSYSWTVIDLVSTNCRLRISDTGETGITDMSDAVFSATKTSFVQLTTPVGGENWLPGTDQNISWAGSGVANIKIELSTDDGSTWSDIVASMNRLLESYTWTVPALESTECIIRISDAADAGISDQNETAFTIASEKENPISIVSVTILDESGPYNTKTDTLDVVVTIRNLTDQTVSDISLVSTVDGNVVTPYYGSLDADADGDIESIGASASIVTVVGNIHLPSSSDSRTIAISQVMVDGDTYALTFEDDITMIYASRDDGGDTVAYDPAVDGFSFANPPGWSWHTFKDELTTLDETFESKSKAVFPFFSKFANWKGRSLGMAAASNLYFSEPSLKPVSDNTYNMSLTDSDVSRDIMLYGLRTLFDYLEDDEQAYDNMSELISDAKTKLAEGNPFILLLKKNQGKAVGKAVSVYKIFETATETIFVAYDCEYPDGSPQFITVSTIDNTVTADETYDQASIVNQETLSDDFALGEEIFEPYTKKFISKLWNDNKDFFGHASPARMLVTDPPTGNQVGFEDGTSLVNEITDASVVEIPNEEEGTGYAFYVPHGPDYTVEFFGQENGTMYVDMIAPQSDTDAAQIVFEEVEIQSGTVAVMEEVDLTAATPPSLQVDLNGDGTTDNTLEPTEAVTIVTEPSDISITITHTPVTEAQENQAIAFTASITGGADVSDVTLHYDVSGRRTFDKTLAMDSSNDQDYSATLSQGSFTALGLEYYIIATASDGKETREPVDTGYNSVQASLSEAISTYNILGGSEVNAYRMISVPLELSHTSITEQLAGRLPTGDSVYDWRLFQYIDQTTGYKEYPEIDGFTPGNANWIMIKEGNSFNHKTHAGQSVTTSESYQITLKPGWNLIADPWFFPISWTNIDNPASATLSELYSYEGNWSDPTSPPTTLEPWKGYAVRNMEQFSAVIKFQPIQAGKTSKIASDTKPLWTVQIAASGGGATDTANYFGAHKSSSLTWDHNDHVEPPPIGQYVSVAFPHDDWEKYPADYTVDMRSPESVADGWAFDVRTNLPGEEITVTFMESETIPVDLDLSVIDLDTGEDISLFNGAFSFVSGNTPTDRHFAVSVGGTYQPGDDKTNVTPQEFVTARSFPNPFNPVTTITYELSHQTDVVISVYNTLGQMVRKYDLGMRDAGKHDLVFDTLGLTSGIYIYRVDAGYATATDKMMFMK